MSPRRRIVLLWSAGISLVAMAVIYSTRHIIAHKAVETGFYKVTGFPLQIGSLRLSPWHSRLEASHVKLLNPPEFVDRVFVDMRRLYVDYEFGSLLRRQPHLSQLDLQINKMVIVKNPDGRSNIQQLSGTGSIEEDPALTSFRIDVLHLEIGTIAIKDYSGHAPKERSLTLNINETFYNITESTDINRLVLLTVMKNVGLSDFGIQGEILRRGLGDVKTSAGHVFAKTTHIVKKTGNKLVNAVKDVVPKGKD